MEGIGPFFSEELATWLLRGGTRSRVAKEFAQES
jgi:hypothetical protein